MNIAVLLSLAATLGYACFRQAGVVPQEWNPCVVAIGVIAAIHFVTPRSTRVPRLSRMAGLSLSIVLGVAVLQLAPLPVGLVGLISPARVELVHAMASVPGGAPKFVTLTAEPYATAQAVLTLASYAVIFLLVRDLTLRMPRRPWAVVWPLIAVAGLEALLGFFQAYGAGGAAQATGTYNSRDHYAGLLEMALPFAVMYAVAILQRNRRPHGMPAGAAIGASGLIAIAALLLIGTVFSLSRMGFFCALASLLTAGILALWLRGWNPDEASAVRPWRKILPAAIIAGLVVAGFILLPTDALIVRFSDLANTDDITADTRAQLWRDTAPLVKDYPLFGCGAGAYESCFLKYKTVAPMNTANFAHNDYLQVLAELGGFGFAAGLAFVFVVLAAAGREALDAPSADERARAIACVAAITAMLLHSFVDFNMYVPANAAVFAWIAGMAASAAPARRSRSESKDPVLAQSA